MPDSLGPQNIERMPLSPEAVGAQERVPSPEKKAEAAVEKIILEKNHQPAKGSVKIPDIQPQSGSVLPFVTPAKIEKVLSADLEKVYLSLDVATQEKFRLEGEKTATAIAKLLQKTKVKTKEIINLIINWLRIIPQINRHFVEQEAKIKADDILKLQPPKK
jgi:hypothetical protein